MSIQFTRKLHTILWGVFAVWTVTFILLYPELSFDASVKGLTLWWKWVFPALLPFFVLVEIGLGLGIIHGIGKLLEPCMRLLFRLPGAASLAFVTGAAAGFPAGAQSTAKLYAKGLLTREESERLLALSHFCHPVIIIHVVAVGFFQNVSLGYIWVAAHYLGLLALGITTRSLGPSNPKDQSIASRLTLRQCLDAMHTAKQADGRSIGQLLGDAVQHAVQTLFKLGGLIIICAVVLELGTLLITHDNIALVFAGVTDIYLGAYSIQSSHLPFFVQVIGISTLFAWSGLSAYAQTQATLQGSGLTMQGFIRARILHGLYAAGFTALSWPWLKSFIPADAHALEHTAASAAIPDMLQISTWQAWSAVWSFGGVMLCLMTFMFCMLSFWLLIRRIR